MQTLDKIKSIVSHVKYKDWQFVVGKKGDGFLIQVQFMGEDTDGSGKLELQKCRKWFVSQHSVDSEVIRSCFLAIRQAEEHELCEHFHYKGHQVYNPHLDMNSMAEFISKKPFEVRKEIKKTSPVPIVYNSKLLLYESGLSSRAIQGIWFCIRYKWDDRHKMKVNILQKFSKKEFLTFRNCGRKTLKEIIEFAKKCNIPLLP